MNKYILSIFVFAVLVRLIYVGFFPQLDVESDALGYDTLARSLASGRGFSENGEPSCRSGPVYPFFLSIIYRIFGHSYLAVRIVQSFLSAIVCLLIYFIGKRTYNSTIGLIAMGLSSIYPAFIAFSGLLLSETLFTFLLSLMVLFSVLGEQTKQIKYWILSGTSLSLATLCRTEALLLPIAILGCWLIFAIPKREFVSRFVALTLTMMFFILPWTYRNYRKFDTFIPVSTGAGALWLANYPDKEVIGTRAEWQPDREPLKSLIANLSPVEADRILFREGIKNIKSHPMTFLKLSFKRAFWFWIGSHSNSFHGLGASFGATLRNKEYSVFFPKLSLLFYNLLYLSLGVSGLGSIACGLNHREAWKTPKIYLVAVIGDIFAIHVIRFATQRYQVPIMPFVIILSAVGISSVQRWLKSWRSNVN